jgi:cysteine desulfurase
MLSKQIYLDYAATTPVDERVLQKMNACMTLRGIFGNPGSLTHDFGQEAAAQVASARQQVANLLGVEARTLIWTSGATEANNLAIQGLAHSIYGKKHIVTSEAEHASILDTCHALETQGFEISYLKPDTRGIISSEQLKALLRPDTLMVSMMHANNETGVLQDIEAIGALTREREIFFHVDAVQSVGKIPLDLKKLPIDLLSLSAHKLYGPKGMGALYVGAWPRVKLQPLLFGGKQERGLRPGTLATHQIVGMGEACYVAQQNLIQESRMITSLRERLWQGIQSLKGVRLNGHPTQKVAGILNVCFSHMEQKALLEAFKGLAVSTAAACHADTTEPSHVLRAMGLSDIDAHRSIRFSIGRMTTIEEIDQTIEIIKRCYVC